MSNKTLSEIYTAAPITTIENADLMYVVRASADKAITGADLIAQFEDVVAGVTSVALSAPNIFTVGGSPVTSTGTLALTLATQSANLIWAGPTTGTAAAPTFRSLVAADIPNLASVYQPLATNLTSIGALANAAGLLRNNGSGTFSYLATTAGGSGSADSGKVILANADGGFTIGATDLFGGNVVQVQCATSNAFYGSIEIAGNAFYGQAQASGTTAFHAHAGAAAGGIAGFDADMTAGTGDMVAFRAYVPSTGAFAYVHNATTPSAAIRPTGNIEWYASGTTLTTGSNKTILAPATPSGTTTVTVPPITGRVPVYDASVAPAANGDLVFEATNNTTVTVKLKGSDGTIRTVALTLS